MPADHHIHDPDADNSPCWCGEANPHYDDEVYHRTCGGWGLLVCRCGGDLCVCHNHDEVECPGCDDCEVDYEEDDDG